MLSINEAKDGHIELTPPPPGSTVKVYALVGESVVNPMSKPTLHGGTGIQRFQHVYMNSYTV